MRLEVRTDRCPEKNKASPESEEDFISLCTKPNQY